MKKIIVFATLCLMLWNVEGKAEDFSTVAFPDTSTWVLIRIGGTKSKQHTGNKVFITVDKKEQKVSGYTSCNFIKGQMVIKDTTVAFPDISFGKRVCDAVTTDLEKQLLEGFQKTTSWEIRDNLLFLYDKGVLILEFKMAGK